MSKTVLCKKLQKEAPAMQYQPLPGELGEKIFKNISEEAWKLWLAHQTMLINEYRLNVRDQKAIEFLEKELENFLFGDGSEKPPGYKD